MLRGLRITPEKKQKTPPAGSIVPISCCHPPELPKFPSTPAILQRNWKFPETLQGEI